MTGAKVLIVTGASSGIGRALAEQAVRAGYNVLATGRRAERLDELRAALGTAAESLATIALDLRTPGAAAAIADAARKHFGRIDVLINNAGLGAAGRLTEQNDGEVREQFETHVIAPLALVREALPDLRAKQGHVFFIGSGVARIPVGGYGAYPAAKAAVRSMARVLRNELHAERIAVTYVDPGVVATEFHTRLGYRPPNIAVTPQAVAHKILLAIRTRPAVLNAVPWQTAFVTLGTMLPTVVDALLARVPALTGAVPLPAAAPANSESTPGQIMPIGTPDVTTQAPVIPDTPRSPLQAALEPVASRMHRLKLSEEFVTTLLIPGVELETSDVALRWAGMPNKNERAIIHDVLEALAEAGLLERLGESHYRAV